MFRKKSILILLTILSVLLVQCGNRSREGFKDFKEFRENELTTDSSGSFITYKNAVFCIPSPQFTSLYLKRLGVYPDRTLINPASNVEKYTTSTKKAINLGVYGVDLGYMNVFTVSESTNEYIGIISKLSGDLGLGIVFTREVYDQIMSLKSNQDSLARFLSEIFSKADLYLKDNAQQQTGIMVITGGWIESFYLLCKAYRKQPGKEITALIFQQKFVLDNLIKALAPYYNSSSEMQSLIDDLVEMAYDFDVFDFKYSYKLPLYRYRKGVVIFENSIEIQNASKSIENIYLKIAELRDNIIE